MSNLSPRQRAAAELADEQRKLRRDWLVYIMSCSSARKRIYGRAVTTCAPRAAPIRTSLTTSEIFTAPSLGLRGAKQYASRAQGIESIVAKRLDRPYRSGRIAELD